MSALAAFAQGLTYLGAALRDGNSCMTIALPRAAYDQLYYEVSRSMVEHSTSIGNGGVILRCPPPEGETYANGFWCQGHWIKAKATP